MFSGIARSVFDAYKRRGATSAVVWHPSSGEPTCEGDVVRATIETEGSFAAFSDNVARIDVIEFVKADFPGLCVGESVTVDGEDKVIRSVVHDDGIVARLSIGNPDFARCA